MVDCAYCERPLICEACQAPFQPPSVEEYRALSEREETLLCPECGEVLVCRWCKTPYDAAGDDEPAGPAAPPVG